MLLTIIVPCYNEEAVLHETARRLLAVADGLKERNGALTRLLFVDDGSTDRTWDLICELGREDRRIAGLKLAHNAGHQHALWAGLTRGVEMGDAVISIDADLQDDPQAIAEMVDKYAAGADIVYGVRKSRSTDTFFKRQSAQLYYRLLAALGGKIVFNHADYRLISRRAGKALLRHTERNLFIRGLVKTLGFREDYVYYDRAERFAGESKYPLRKMLAFAWDGITSFSVRPLRLITLLGLLFMLVSVGIIAWALLTYSGGHAMRGWTSLLVSLWFVGGAILAALGIIGEYIGKIYSEVKRRPLFFVETTTGLDEPAEQAE